jgi:hypothetical protein
MKKGFVYSGKDLTLQNKLKQLNVSWYYTWNPDAPADSTLPFTPMVWSTKHLPKANIPLETPGVDNNLLCINEPDMQSQANMTVEDVVAIWSQFEATGRRLGSPATASNASRDGSWFANFMTAASMGGLKVDFIAIHWYAPPNPTSLLGLVDTLYQKYKLPIWITEFAVADWKATSVATNRYTQDQVIAFMRQVLPELDKRPYVEKYAWKTRSTSDMYMWSSAIFNDDGSLTQVGECYAAHQSSLSSSAPAG